MMTYRGFHLRWTIPLSIASMTIWAASPSPFSALVVLSGLCLVVVAFTFPWDDWAVAQGVWDFPSDRVLYRVRHLPIEEVFFFVIQTIQVGALTAALAAYMPSTSHEDVRFDTQTLVSLSIVSCAWVGAWFVARRWRRVTVSVTYAWHLLFWFAPVIIMQWVFGWPILGPRTSIIVLASVSIGTILVLSDIWAVKRGIWFFDEKQITGLKAFGVLPWEEIAFFYVTSILVSQSTLLLLPSSAR
ncbi:MAG: lycopene cyclase domain-containing protein [Ignavibacteria bacterium]|nr:lycopene cyclase domain-containing protein [Ignavibacteria bacterium]